MDSFRIANFVMQAIYLPLHLMFIVRLVIGRQASPVWRWFIVVVAGLWFMVAGRFGESIVYLFRPDNRLYVLAVCFQLTGTTFATSSYLIWNLVLAGHTKLSESKGFVGLMMVLSHVISAIICTNPLHHLFYAKLQMGEPVVHGPLFIPCLLIVYGTLFAGFVVSVVHILRKEEHKLGRLIVFSLYPVLPAAAALVRSISGVDRLDWTPIIMTVSLLCLYLMVFRFRYVQVISQSIENVIAETGCALVEYDPVSQQVTWQNRAAEEKYSTEIPGILSDAMARGLISEDGTAVSGQYEGKSVRVQVTPVSEGKRVLLTIVDLGGIREQQELLAGEIRRQDELVEELEEKKRNIDAYIENIYQVQDTREKLELIRETEAHTREAFLRLDENLARAEADPSDADPALLENMRITEETIAEIRRAVSALKEGTWQGV